MASTAAAASWTTGKGAAKRIVGELEKAQPFHQVLGERMPYNGNIKRLGKSFIFPVVMQPPNGVTYVGANPTAQSLKGGRPMNIQEAEAFSYEMDVLEQTPWAVFERMRGGQQSVDAYLSILMLFLKRTGQTRREASLLLGQNATGWGTVSTVTDHTTYATIVFTAATWRGGLWWAAGPGATFDSFTSTTKNNSTGALVLVGVNPINQSIDVQYQGTLASEITAGDNIFPEGAYDGTTFYDMPGLLVQDSNTTGTMLGLSAASFPNWAANTAAVGGLFTEDAEEYYLGLLRNRGGKGKMSLYMPEPTWRDRVAAHQGKRMFDESYTPNKQRTGEQDFDYSTAVYGQVEHVLLSFLADSEVLMQVDEECTLVGSRDTSLGIPSRVLGDKRPTRATTCCTCRARTTASRTARRIWGIVQRMPSSAQLLTAITH